MVISHDKFGLLKGTAFRRTEGDAGLPPLTSEDWRTLSGSCPELEGEARSLSEAPDPCSRDRLRVLVTMGSAGVCCQFGMRVLQTTASETGRWCVLMGSAGVCCKFPAAETG